MKDFINRHIVTILCVIFFSCIGILLPEANTFSEYVSICAILFIFVSSGTGIIVTWKNTLEIKKDLKDLNKKIDNLIITQSHNDDSDSE